MRADLTERVLRGVYSLALYALVPVTAYHLVWRGFRQPEYFLRWNERYARYRGQAQAGRAWVHAVSVGEVNAAKPLVDALLAQSRPVLVTTITPTGSARVASLWGERVAHVYLPYDLPGMVRRFLEHHRPHVALIMETELWPNLLFGLRDHGVPGYIVNGRLSERSLRGYRFLRPFLARALRTLRALLVQSGADAARFVRLGALPGQVQVAGNLKYDIARDADAAQLARSMRLATGTRPVWIAASTHPDEEAPVLAMHARLRARWPDLLLWWAPRHPERFKPVVQQAIAAGWQVATRRLTHTPGRDDAVFVIDTLGELGGFYGAADVAFVGGSLQDIGGHNLLEPAAAGCPVVTGPHLHNFSEIAARMRQAGALRVGADAESVGDAVEALLADADARAAMAAAGRTLVEEGRGALQRTLAAIEPDLPAPVVAPAPREG